MSSSSSRVAVEAVMLRFTPPPPPLGFSLAETDSVRPPLICSSTSVSSSTKEPTEGRGCCPSAVSKRRKREKERGYEREREREREREGEKVKVNTCQQYINLSRGQGSTCM